MPLDPMVILLSWEDACTISGLAYTDYSIKQAKSKLSCGLTGLSYPSITIQDK